MNSSVVKLPAIILCISCLPEAVKQAAKQERYYLRTIVPSSSGHY
jgi:hypothetical protein